MYFSIPITGHHLYTWTPCNHILDLVAKYSSLLGLAQLKDFYVIIFSKFIAKLLRQTNYQRAVVIRERKDKLRPRAATVSATL